MEIFTQLNPGFETKLLIYAGLVSAVLVSVPYTFRAIASRITRDIIKMMTLTTLFFTAAAYSTTIMVAEVRGVPRVVATIPTRNQPIDPAFKNIVLTFSAPVYYDSLSINTHPIIDFDIIKSGYLWNALPFGTQLTIVPKTTLPPGEHIMLYVANIEGPATAGYGGEHLIEVTVQDTTLTKATPGDNTSEVAQSQTFTLDFTTPIASLAEWSVRTDPPHPMRITQKGKQTLLITSQEPLHQDTSYTMTVIQTPVILSRQNNAVVRTLDPRTRATLHFHTVKPVFITAFTPQEDSVDPRFPIIVKFDTPMNTESVKNNFAIKPATPLTFAWSADKQSVAITHPEFAKNTRYEITLGKSIMSEKGGSLSTDINYHFQTAGPLRIRERSPSQDATGVSVDSAITLTFDQDITSAVADYMETTPKITGNFSIKNNKLDFIPTKPLAYETAYTVRLKTGAPSVYGLPSSGDQSATFTTAADQTSLAVPYFGQQTLFTCNIAAARMLLAYRGVTVTEGDLINVIGRGGKRGSGNPNVGYIDDYGTYWDAVLRGVTSYHPARLITSGKLTDILTEVKKGNPVMTWGQNGWSDPHEISWTATDGTYIRAVNGMHSMVVRGYVGPIDNPRQILINDPWRGQYALDTKEFMRRWGYFSIAMVIE